MKTFQEKFMAVLTALGLVKAAKKNELSDENWTAIKADYKTRHGVEFAVDLEADANAAQTAADHAAALALINAAGDGDGAGAGDGDGAGAGGDDGAGAGDGDGDGAGAGNNGVVLQTAVAGLISRANNAEAALALMAATQEPNEPHVGRVVFDVTGIARPHTDTHLFGVDHAIYDRSARWNRLFSNSNLIHGMAEASKEEQNTFNDQLSTFAGQVSVGVAALHAAGQLNVQTLRSADNPNIDALSNAGLGDQFVQLRVRELIARVLEIPNPYGIFPRRFGVQDRELITNEFVGELTQAWQDSETSLKGSSVLDPEWGYVDDAMILSKFGSFKVLERRYIGYLNTDGSDPIKWGMIEHTMLIYMKQAVKEQYKRVVIGIFNEPVAGTPSHFLNASTGHVNRMYLYHIEKKLKTYVDASLATYDSTGTVFLDAVEEWGDWLLNNLDPLGVGVEENLSVYLNKNHMPWYKSGYRSKYNLHGDFDGVNDMVIQDTNIKIIWVPNMDGLKTMWATQPGNQQSLENIPGEMFKFYFERRLNNVYVQSVWKEGTAAGFAGKLSANKAALDARPWDEQLIWFPKPYTALADGDTTADGSTGFWFTTISNTGATAFTEVTNDVAGQLYILECTNLTNATTVAKAALFSEITGAYTPTALGDLLAFVWDAGLSKYKEICRVVGGVLTYNAASTPNAGIK